MMVQHVNVQEVAVQHTCAAHTKEAFVRTPCAVMLLLRKLVSAIGEATASLSAGGVPDAAAATTAVDCRPLTYVEDSSPRRADGALGVGAGLAGLADALHLPGAHQQL